MANEPSTFTMRSLFDTPKTIEMGRNEFGSENRAEGGIPYGDVLITDGRHRIHLQRQRVKLVGGLGSLGKAVGTPNSFLVHARRYSKLPPLTSFHLKS
ncbi:hypothetical protein L596_006960 [Steinernema carpocapsae]|uniref:Uncharacterized protein n=1 Tax=Steinernema carpocapsae TaxID=34508 RepID=A0A4U5P8I2_STECR|nr:hypothetical protein L596_006960 [Steinernema carpocapsae]